MSFSIILEVGNLVLFSIPCSSSSSVIQNISSNQDLLSDLWHSDLIFFFFLTLVQVKNSRGDVLQCSHYLPIVSPEGKPLPCVIYCHGNR